MLELLRLVDALAEEWTRHPPPMLRAGGVGVRELRRTARVLDVAEPTAALLIEVACGGRADHATNGIDPAFLPTAGATTPGAAATPAERWSAAGRRVAGHDPPAQPGRRSATTASG